MKDYSKTKAYIAMHKIKRQTLGLCLNCNNPLKTKLLCEAHAKKHIEAQEAYMQRVRGGEYMKKRKGYKQMDQKGFDTVKTLLNVGLSAPKIHEITGRATGTISYIKQSETYADYQALIAKIVLKYDKTKNGTVNSVPQTTEETAQQVEKVPVFPQEELVKVLWEIRDQVKRLADAWETPAQKKGFFERITG